MNPKAFLSCSLKKEDKEVVDFFKKILESIGFDVFIYDFPEPRGLTDAIKGYIRECDCLVALATRREKIENKEKFFPPSWVLNEITFANSFNKPVGIIVEKSVKLEGLPSTLRFCEFNRDNLLENINEIIKYLTKLKEEVKQRTSLFPQILIRNYVYHKIYISSERERIAETQIKMTALQPLASVYHSFSPSHRITSAVSLEPKLFEYNVEGERDAKCEIITQDRSSVLIRINFDPPLKEGETVEYWYRYSPKKSSTPFTLEEAKEAAPLDSHLSDIATDSVLILYPTERLKFEIKFDSKYPVYEPNFTVTIGFTNTEVKPEIERLKGEGAFKVERFAGRTKTILDVFRPFIGCRYTIYWKPPSEEDIV